MTPNQPFHTSNAILAYCLHMAGVPWENNHEPAKVLYSAEILNKFTNGQGEPIYKGWQLEDAVRDAHKKKRRGHIEYVFKNTPRLGVLLKAYVDQAKYLEQAEGAAHELVLSIAKEKIDTDVATLRIACVLMKMRAEFMEIWEHQVPIVMIPNPGHSRRGAADNTGSFTIESPGYRMVSLNASKETREHLGL
jgi:hypothetical protein